MLQRIASFWRGILALFFRSLRTESRSLRIHLLWLVLMLVIYFTLWIVHETTTSFGAPGLYFFRSVMYLNAIFISLLGISFFSTVISEEKEEDTLGLMTMAGISPLGILFGKSTSRLFQVSLLLAIQYPFTLLAVTMGGLMPVQIASAYTALLAYTILLANVGLLCSVACRTNRNASGLTTFWLLGYLAVPAFAYSGMMYLQLEYQWVKVTPPQNLGVAGLVCLGELRTGGISPASLQNFVLTGLEHISKSTIITELLESTETGHQFHWSPQIVGNTLGGVICFFLSLLLFGFVAKEPSQETSSRGLVARRTSRRLSVFSAGRTWGGALIWKDFFFTAGGWAGLVIRFLLYGGLYGLCYAANRPWYMNSGGTIRLEDVTHGFQAFAHPLLAIDVALCASRVFSDEIRGQTLSSLLMLPDSIPALVYSKIMGCALATLPGFFALAVSMLLPGGTEFMRDLGDNPVFWWWLMNLVFMVHLTALYSLFLRSGAFVLALGTMIGTMIMTGFFLTLVSIGGGADTTEVMLGSAAVVLGMLSVGCHALILLRMPALGQR